MYPNAPLSTPGLHTLIAFTPRSCPSSFSRCSGSSAYRTRSGNALAPKSAAYSSRKSLGPTTDLETKSSKATHTSTPDSWVHCVA